MDKILVWAGLPLLVISNVCIIKIQNVFVLCGIAMGVLVLNILTHSTTASLRRLRVFIFIGFSIIIFQILFNHAFVLADRIVLGIRTTLQIALISEIVFFAFKYISPKRIVSALSFLPRRVLLLLTMTFTFIPLLLTEQHSIRIAQYSRGLGMTARSKVLAPIAFLIPLIHRIFQRAEAVSYSMVARGLDEE